MEVATSKYLDHLPLERQARIMKREGLQIDSQTLWDQINLLAHHLKPSYDALGQRVWSSELIGADETYWRLMGSHARKRWWVWGLATTMSLPTISPLPVRALPCFLSRRMP